MSKKGLPLEGIRVIEYANYVAAPVTGRLLADWGAEVIKIEPLEGDSMRGVGMQWNFPIDDEENPLFEIENSGKKGILVDTNTKEGVDLVYKLLEDADVFLTNTRQRALDKSGLNYETMKAKAPHIIYGHLLGYGDNGPAKDNPAFDYTAYFARGGIAASLMEKGTSPCNSVAGLGDHSAGMSLAAGILAALHKQRQTGEGERVTVSLFHTAVFGMGIMVSAAKYDYHMPITRRNPPNPLNTTYKCADGIWVQLAFFQYNKWFPGFCDIVIERPDLKDSKYNTLKSAVQNTEEFVIMMEKEFAKRPFAEWAERLQAAGIPYEKLATPKDILEDEQCWANDYLIKHTYDNGHEGVIYNTPVMFTENKRGSYVRAPYMGEHTDEVMAEIGLEADVIEKYKKEDIIK
ncbi:MAG: CoA transferase [Anaerovoracaceae bacterium]